MYANEEKWENEVSKKDESESNEIDNEPMEMAQAEDFVSEEFDTDDAKIVDFAGVETKAEKIKPLVKSKPTKNSEKDDKLTPRQKEVLSLLKAKKTLEMKDLLGNIKGVTERTLRRDLLKLQELGFVKKVGTTKSVKYHLITK